MCQTSSRTATVMTEPQVSPNLMKGRCPYEMNARDCRKNWRTNHLEPFIKSLCNALLSQARGIILGYVEM